MELQHQQNPDKFLSERLQAASQYQQHFQHLLTIWVVAIAVLALLSYFLFKRKMIVGVLCGLAICCVASLLLDFTGFKADASYYAGLKKLAITKNIQLKY